jgi:hypothetical protein
LDTRQNGQASRIVREKAVVPPIDGRKSVNMAAQASSACMLAGFLTFKFVLMLENGEKLAISRLAGGKSPIIAC